MIEAEIQNQIADARALLRGAEESAAAAAAILKELSELGVTDATADALPDPAPAVAAAPDPSPPEKKVFPGVKYPLPELKVALIVGHEPKAPGAVNPSAGLSEYDFNLPLARSIATDVWRASEESISVQVVLRHPEGYSRLPAKVNATGAAFALELHANASNGRGHGTEMIYLKGSEEGARLAARLQTRVLHQLDLRDRGIKNPWAGRGEPLLRGTRMPCVICEPFFIDNASDFAAATSAAGRDALVYAYTAGILDYAKDRWERGLWK